ncbi:Jerky-like protein, partial [Stegodyphus mimosarum]
MTEISDIFSNIFVVCEAKDIDTFIEEQQGIQDNIDELFLMLTRVNAKNVKDLSVEANSCEISSIRLPKLTLPVFSGSAEEWLSFNDLFKTAIVDNGKLSGAQKLQYLKFSLKGDALRIVQALTICDKNFEIAWNLLCQRFSNKRELVSSLLKKILCLTSLQAENPSQLLTLVDTVKECICSFETLGFKVEQLADTILMFIVQFKLDSSTRSWWERTLKREEIPTRNDLLEFLKSHARTLQADSRVTLAWISSEPRRWLPFVANRVARIQEAVPGIQWNYVVGKENPADFGTRGLIPSEFLRCELWMKGPQWLSQPMIHVQQDLSVELESMNYSISVIRHRFWIVSARDIIRKCLNQCVICRRFRAQTATQQMADLPASRVTQSRAFSRVGIDFAGPFNVKYRNGRGAKIFKCYICLFICFTTRAIHLELVGDLSTKSFLATLKRFIARRGKPCEIHSDCATNFIGANKELRKVLSTVQRDEHLQGYISSENIKWLFNPPSAPHFGGLWEAGIKSMKHHLKRCLGTLILTYEEFLTLITQIESCLNSRPLVPASSDCSDLEALTPEHFLTGAALSALPEPNLIQDKLSYGDRWKNLQRLFQQFWKRWSSEYLSRLQQRPKWCKLQRDLKIGDMVLIKNENLPPLRWKLGRIVKVYPGLDDRIRVVDLRTSSANNNLTPLSCEEENEDVDTPTATLADMVKTVPGGENVDAENIKEWLECDVNEPGFERLTDDEIVKKARGDTKNEGERSESEEEPTVQMRKTHEAALQQVDGLLSYLEEQDDAELTEKLMLRKIQSRIKRKCFQSKKETQMTDIFKKV